MDLTDHSNFDLAWLRGELDESLATVLVPQGPRAHQSITRIVEAYATWRKSSLRIIGPRAPRDDIVDVLEDADTRVVMLIEFDFFSESKLLDVFNWSVEPQIRIIGRCVEPIDPSDDDQIMPILKSAEIIDALAYYVEEDGWVWSIVPREVEVAAGISDELSIINEHRRKIGMTPLDPDASGWTDEDVMLEAQRIRALNPRQLARERMLAW
jgi:hypothetical protein